MSKKTTTKKQAVDTNGPTKVMLSRLIKSLRNQINHDYRYNDAERVRLQQAVEAIEKEYDDARNNDKRYLEAKAKLHKYEAAYDKAQKYRLQLLEKAANYFDANGVTQGTINRFNAALEACERPICVV